MKQILVIMAAVVLVGCGENREAKDKKLTKAEAYAELLAEAKKAREAEARRKAIADPIANPIVEKAVREMLEKPEGELTKADLEKVTFLNLERLQLTDVKGLEKLTQLKALYLNGNQLTDLKRLEKLTQLEALSLADNHDLTKAQIAELQKALPECKIGSNPGEKIISITDPIVEKAVRERIRKRVGDLTETNLENVTSLNLTSTQITDDGLKDLAKLQKLTNLSLPTQITDVGLKEVAKLQKLERLELISSQITDAGLEDVAKLQKLRNLILARTQITDAGLKAPKSPTRASSCRSSRSF